MLNRARHRFASYHVEAFACVRQLEKFQPSINNVLNKCHRCPCVWPESAVAQTWSTHALKSACLGLLAASPVHGITICVAPVNASSTSRSANADGLKVGHSLRLFERVERLAAMTIARGQRLQIELRELRLVGPADAQTQADMKGDGQIHVGELFLRIKIGGIGDDPPAIDIGVQGLSSDPA
jgi:hypothetical protein